MEAAKLADDSASMKLVQHRENWSRRFAGRITRGELAAGVAPHQALGGSRFAREADLQPMAHQSDDMAGIAKEARGATGANAAAMEDSERAGSLPPDTLALPR